MLPAVKALLKESGEIIALIKPQFERKRKGWEKKALSEKSTHKEVINNVVSMQCKKFSIIEPRLFSIKERKRILSI